MKKNIVVIFGGKSTEHDISILTAVQMMNALDESKYNILPVYITHAGKWLFGEKLKDVSNYKNFDESGLLEVAILPSSQFLFERRFGRFKKTKRIDCAVISCHGKNGEDGTIQGLLELANIPYTSCGIDGSVLGIDKVLMKQIFEANQIPIVPYVHFLKSQFENINLQDIEKSIPFKFPVIVKPSKLGSSIGISICKDISQLCGAFELAFKFDDEVVVEKLVENLKEVNISVLGDACNCEVSPIEEVQNDGKFLSFESKYLHADGNSSKIVDDKKHVAKNGMQNSERIIPAKLKKSQRKQIEQIAKRIFVATKAKGVVRIDFLIDSVSGEVFANEINTIPGSFAFYLWQEAGISFGELADRLVAIAIEHNKRQNDLLTTFSSSVLDFDCTRDVKLQK